MQYKVLSKCINFFLRVCYVNVNAKAYKTIGVYWKEGGKLLMNIYIYIYIYIYKQKGVKLIINVM